MAMPGRAAGALVKVAVRLWASESCTLQVLVPPQAPAQPLKVEPGAALALRVSFLPARTWGEQLAAQSIPAALLLTEPAPVPAIAIARVRVPTAVKTALTVLVQLIVFSQGPEPVQPPPDQ